ncbi:MAG: helix-turn-helix domain-containing protein [Anaerolineae bacterium]|nr:helix-turn-helix domain-containing protein [Anaerolineae bacterium]
MAHRRFTLTEQEIIDLQRAEDATQAVRELKRLQAVRLYGSGHAVQAIQEVVGCSWRALMDWCRAYRERGLEGLKSHWQGDNALKLTRDQRADLKTRLEQYRPDQVLAPNIRVHQGQFWTVSDLKIVVHQWYGVTYQSDTSYRTLLHECRFSQQQTEPQYRSRPTAQVVADFEAVLEKK